MIALEKQTLVDIANNCSGYEFEGRECFTSSLTPAEGEKSCVNCSHLYKSRCQFDLMEKVLNQIK